MHLTFSVYYYLCVNLCPFRCKSCSSRCPKHVSNNRPKLFANNLTIQCPFPENDCRWYQLRDNVQQPVETDELIANNSIFLLENNAYSYGEYTARSSNNESVCYTVCPFPIGEI